MALTKGINIITGSEGFSIGKGGGDRGRERREVVLTLTRPLGMV